MSAIRAAWGWIAGGALALIAGLLLWNHRRTLVSKARSEAAWATKEAERLSRVRAEKLTKADADAAQVELLGKRADALHAHAYELKKATLAATDEELRESMKRLGILAAFLTLALAPGVHAQDIPRDCAPEATEHRGEPAIMHGLHGWWFRGEVTRCLVAGFAEMRMLKEELSLTRAQLRLRSNQVELFRSAIEEATESELRARRALVTAESALAEEDGSWVFLASGASFVIGVVATIAVAFALGGM